MKKLHLKTVGVFASLFLASWAWAQDPVAVSLSDESGNPGDTVEVTLTFQGNGESSGFEGDITYDDTDFSAIDLSDCLDGSSAAFDSCAHPGGDTSIIRVILANDAATPLQNFTGIIRFTIAGGATAPQTIPLVWDELSLDATDPAASVNATDGSVAVQSGPQPDLTFNPVAGSTIDFMGVQSGQSENRTIEVCNASTGDSGSVVESITATLNSGSPEFSVDDSNCASASLSPGSCCDVLVTFTPSSGGNTAFAGQMDIDTSAGSGAFDLQGTGTDGPAANLAISPTSHDYGDVLTGDSATFTFTVSNSGEADSEASIDAITPPAGDFTVSGGTCTAGSTTLSDGESCTIVLEFAPAADGAQGPSDLVVDGTDTLNSSSLQATSSVQGTGVSEARFSSDPAPGAVNMGQAPPGGSLSQTVTVTNEGNENLTVNNCTETDPDNLFTFTPDPIDFSIAPDASDSFSVSCTVPEPGSFTASLSCDTNDPNNATVTYDFTCTGQVLQIPTMQPWGLVLLTMLMLMIGGLSIRYFRI